jgi:hypothetical protein
MTTLVLKPSRSAEDADTLFEQLLDTDEAAARLLRIFIDRQTISVIENLKDEGD